MKKLIGTIACGCAESCGGRIKLYYVGAHKNILAITPHGVEPVEVYRDSINNYHDAVVACTHMYCSTVWEADFRNR